MGKEQLPIYLCRLVAPQSRLKNKRPQSHIKQYTNYIMFKVFSIRSLHGSLEKTEKWQQPLDIKGLWVWGL